MSEAAPAKEKEAEAPKKTKKRLSGKLKIGIILGVIVGVQCVLAWLLIPSGDDAEAKEPKHDKKAHSSAITDPDLEDPHGERREVDLGRFSITSIDPASNTTMLIDFHLYGAVLFEPDDHAAAEEAAAEHGDDHGKKKEDGEPEDNTRFGRLLKKNKHRFRDQVIVVIRNAQMSDLSDPALGLIKRQILAKTNSLLGEPLLKEVIFSDFAVVQQ
jgi:flagellar basal body-associated protein FliL